MDRCASTGSTRAATSRGRSSRPARRSTTFRTKTCRSVERTRARAMARAITAEEFVAAPVLSDPRLAPNGHDVAYVERSGATGRVFLNGAAFTSGAPVEDQPRWM